MAKKDCEQGHGLYEEDSTCKFCDDGLGRAGVPVEASSDETPSATEEPTPRKRRRSTT